MLTPLGAARPFLTVTAVRRHHAIYMRAYTVHRCVHPSATPQMDNTSSRHCLYQDANELMRLRQQYAEVLSLADRKLGIIDEVRCCSICRQVGVSLRSDSCHDNTVVTKMYS